MKKGRRMRIFLLRKRYLAAVLAVLLAAAMFLAACLPEALLSQAAGPLAVCLAESFEA